MAGQASIPVHMPGFTAEQAASLHTMVTASIAEALKRGQFYRSKSGTLVTQPQNSVPTSSDRTSSHHDQKATESLQHAVPLPEPIGILATIEKVHEARASTATRNANPPIFTSSAAKRSERLPSDPRNPKDHETFQAEIGAKTVISRSYTDLEYSNACPKLPRTQPLGYSHLIDLKRFTVDTIKDDIRMADIIGTVLFNYAPGCLEAFLDQKEYRVVKFKRTDVSFCIERVDYTVMITYGSSGRVPRHWGEAFGCTIAARGKLQVQWHYLGGALRILKKKALEVIVQDFATRILLDMKWDGKGYEINVYTEHVEKPVGRVKKRVHSTTRMPATPKKRSRIADGGFQDSLTDVMEDAEIKDEGVDSTLDWGSNARNLLYHWETNQSDVEQYQGP